jgi:hypothetical protein
VVKTAITGAIAFFVGYFVSDALVSSLVTGTGTGDTLIQTLAPIALGGFVAWAAIALGGGK